MKQVQVFGSGCTNCTKTAEILAEAAKQMGEEVELIKVTEAEKIMLAGIMRTPGVAVDGVVKHSGSVPSMEQAKEMLKA